MSNTEIVRSKSKRLLDSPPQNSPSKRSMGNNDTNPSNEVPQPITESSLRSILNTVLDEKLIAIATKEDVTQMKSEITQLKSGMVSHDKRLDRLEWKQR